MIERDDTITFQVGDEHQAEVYELIEEAEEVLVILKQAVTKVRLKEVRSVKKRDE